MGTMVMLILLMALPSVTRGDPDYKINLDIQLSTGGTTHKNVTTTHLINKCDALQKKVNKLSVEQTVRKRNAMKTHAVVKDLSERVVDLEEAVAFGDPTNKRPNTCTLNCGKCQCKQDERLLDGYFCDCRHYPPMRDCASFKAAGFHKSGVYVINMTINPLLVYCDQQIDGGGWIVFQRRLDGTVDFYKSWQWYKRGFGAVQHEHWLGNDHIHQLTKSNKMQLRIEMTYFEGHWKKFHAKYSQFQIEDENHYYKLTLGTYSGNNGDAMSRRAIGMKFSTFDRDHDTWPANCAVSFKGGWWYADCHDANLNGRYYGYKEEQKYSGIHWATHDRYEQSMLASEMKMKMNV